MPHEQRILIYNEINYVLSQLTVAAFNFRNGDIKFDVIKVISEDLLAYLNRETEMIILDEGGECHT